MSLIDKDGVIEPTIMGKKMTFARFNGEGVFFLEIEPFPQIGGGS